MNIGNNKLLEVLIFSLLYPFSWIQNICTVNSRNITPKQYSFHLCCKLQTSDVLALCLKIWSPLPIGMVLLLLLLPRAAKGLHGCLVELSRIRDQGWAPGSPWTMDRDPRGGLVSTETQCLLSLPWTSSFFTEASQPGQTLPKICVIPFSHASPLAT